MAASYRFWNGLKLGICSDLLLCQIPVSYIEKTSLLSEERKW